MGEDHSMNSFWGADSDQLEQQALRVSIAAERLVELQDQLGALVLDESIWHGPDATLFREEWRARALIPSHRAGDELRRRADELRENAEAQDRASSVGGSSGPSAPPSFLGANTMGTGINVNPSPGHDGPPIANNLLLTLDQSDLIGRVEVCPPADPRIFARTLDTVDIIGCTGLPPLR